MFDKDINIRHGAFLPHWMKDSGIYHVRIRLADSLPQSKLEEWKEERVELTRNVTSENRNLSLSEQKHLEFLFSEKVEQFLDSGHGACWLKRNEIAETVSDALWHSNGKRYKLFAWCIMPNHVHVVMQMIVRDLHKVLHSWKTFTANKANRLLGRKGSFWQREYFDHLIRNQEKLEQAVEYVWNNPEKAGLKNWKLRWRADM